MTQSYFLVEAINIVNNVFDTDQLSVIRGSSFLLKQAIDDIKDKYESDLEPISTGASSGIFRKKENEKATSEVKGNIIKLLRDNEKCSLFTFAVESCQAENLLQAREKLRKQLRINQLQSISIAPDIQKEAINQPCQLDGARLQGWSLNQNKPLERKVHKKVRRLSHSVCLRLDEGRELRGGYYEKELKEDYPEELVNLGLDNIAFSRDLESLAETKQFKKLNNKIAVIYIDGNDFGKKQRELVSQAEKQGLGEQAQKDFDDDVQARRKKFLLSILQNMVGTKNNRFPDAHYQNDENKQVLRLETLLWGGDEMTIVVPAWLGFEMMQLFFEKFANWEHRGEPLTHAAGIVFCSAKSPIRIMRDLAKSLADNIKDNCSYGRDKNLWDYIILESIDYPANNIISDYRTKRYKPFGIEQHTPLPPAENWQPLKSTLHKLLNRGSLPRGQLYQIIHAIAEDHTNQASNNMETESSGMPSTAWKNLNQLVTDSQLKQEQQEKRLLQVGDNDLKERIPKIASGVFGINDMDDHKQRAIFWIHLVECWDYLISEIKGAE